uniref:Uncharacterized protein n=1 Tax=Arundo donax TaxID=35708 RepID=A0A0A9B3Q4_ARUDO
MFPTSVPFLLVFQKEPGGGTRGSQFFRSRTRALG